MKDQRLNIGDMLLCKNDMTDFFCIGIQYKVNIIQKNNMTSYYYGLINDSNLLFPFYDEDYLYTYFYRKNEARKLKLIKIYEESKY